MRCTWPEQRHSCASKTRLATSYAAQLQRRIPKPHKAHAHLCADRSNERAAAVCVCGAGLCACACACVRFQSGQFNEDMIPTIGFNMRKVTKDNVSIKVRACGY